LSEQINQSGAGLRQTPDSAPAPRKVVAVTGATGFLGSHLVRELLARGYEVRGLARSGEKAAQMDTLVKPFVGDICDSSVLADMCDGCEWVFHTVSNFRTASGPRESYRHINVEGTRQILEAAAAAGVKRFIHCSTIGVHGDVRDSPATEDSLFNPGDLYQETKLEAELLVREAVGTWPMEIVVIRPCSMYGPGDLRMLKMFRMLSKRTFFKVGPCRENFHAVYIDDVVEGFLRAAEQPGVSGEVFLIGGPSYLPLEEYIDTAARAVGAPRPFIRFPYWLLHSAAWLCERVFVPLGLEPPLHIRRVRFFRNNRAFSIAKARSRLGYEPKIPLKDGMRRTVSWYRAQGLLPRP
jgi:dihydroflavonol-4-reductase